MRPPRSASTAEVAEVEAQKPEAFTSLKVDYAALFIIDFNLQLAELLPKSFVHGPNQPVMSLIGVDQDHQIVCEPRIFDVVYLPLRGLSRLASSTANHLAAAVPVNADRDQHRLAGDHAGLAHPLIARVEDQIGEGFGQRATGKLRQTRHPAAGSLH